MVLNSQSQNTVLHMDASAGRQLSMESVNVAYQLHDLLQKGKGPHAVQSVRLVI